MRIIIGLGNPGKKYKNTRHNAGFLVLDALADRLNTRFADKPGWSAQTAKARRNDTPVLLIKPQTFMNKSGEALQAILRQTNVAPEEILVIYDDVDLPFGDVRFREKGSAGGHNGMKSVLSCFTKDARIPRVRLGIGRPNKKHVPIKTWVLNRWSDDERAQLPDVVDRAADRALAWLD